MGLEPTRYLFKHQLLRLGCLANSTTSAFFVPKERLELSSFSATASKTAVSTNSTIRASAENVGFEPTVQFSSYNGLANRPHRPLGQFSFGVINGIRTHTNRTTICCANLYTINTILLRWVELNYQPKGYESFALPLSYIAI